MGGINYAERVVIICTNPSLQAGICGWWRALEAVGVFTPENTYYAAAHSLPTTPPLSEEENQK